MSGAESRRDGSPTPHDAAVLVRAEAQLSDIISEMRVGDDGTASLYLDRERIAVVVDLDRANGRTPRALKVRSSGRAASI